MLEQLYAEAKEAQASWLKFCVVGQWANTLSESDQKAFNLSLNDDDFSSRALFILYKNAGAPFGLTSLKEHRNGACSCR